MIAPEALSLADTLIIAFTCEKPCVVELAQDEIFFFFNYKVVNLVAP